VFTLYCVFLIIYRVTALLLVPKERIECPNIAHFAEEIFANHAYNTNFSEEIFAIQA